MCYLSLFSKGSYISRLIFDNTLVVKELKTALKMKFLSISTIFSLPQNKCFHNFGLFQVYFNAFRCSSIKGIRVYTQSIEENPLLCENNQICQNIYVKSSCFLLFYISKQLLFFLLSVVYTHLRNSFKV